MRNFLLIETSCSVFQRSLYLSPKAFCMNSVKSELVICSAIFFIFFTFSFLLSIVMSSLASAVLMLCHHHLAVSVRSSSPYWVMLIYLMASILLAIVFQRLYDRYVGRF